MELWASWIWALALPGLIGCSLWLTCKTRGYAFRRQLSATRRALRPDRAGQSGFSPFACLCTALATTVGTGNIAGVAFALTAAGPGALVWMWISAALGCAVKYKECALAVLYRTRTKPPLGGPMVTLSRLHPGRLGVLLGGGYAIVMTVNTLGAGNLVQSSAIAGAAHAMTGLSPAVIGVLVGSSLLLILSGGAKSVTQFSTALVPVMLGLYLLGGLAVLATHLERLPAALAALFRSAFDLRCMGAGAFANMVRVGVTRGCFSNDSGTGSAAFSAALTSAAPEEQGLISATANLWDTGVVCSVTALAILVSGQLDSGLTGVALAMAAYQTGLGKIGGLIVGCCLLLFAFSTLPGLAFQGEQALAYLRHSPRLTRCYRLLFALTAALGCLVRTEHALAAVDCCNGLMVLLNLFALLPHHPLDEIG